jgi:fatty-acyl-CoA synthase
MSNAHCKFWPTHSMRWLTALATNLFYNVEVSARRYPDKPYLVFYDTPVTFALNSNAGGSPADILP